MAEDKPLFNVVKDQDVEVELTLKESTRKTISDYKDFLKDASGSEVEIGEILDVLVPTALKKDKAFTKWSSK